MIFGWRPLGKVDCNSLISPILSSPYQESPAYDAKFPFGLAEHRLSLSAKFNMRQKPNFGAAVNNGTSTIAAPAALASRVNLESQFDGEKDDGGNGGGEAATRTGSRKAGVKPPTSLSVEIDKSKTPRGDRYEEI